MSDWRQDLSWSARDFIAIVWPQISGWCHGGELRPVEGVTDRRTEADLDRLAGIDAWQIVDGVGMRGIASRVQAMEDSGYTNPWASFTIRERRTSGAVTELAKRMRAMDDDAGWLLPDLTVQAYLDRRGGRLLHVAMTYTRQLYEHVRDTTEWVRRTNGDDGNLFLVVWHHDLQDEDRRVRHWTAKGITATCWCEECSPKKRKARTP